MKLVLGTVQFGLSYGVTNNAGQPSPEQAFAVLDAAWDANVRILDSAQEYGEANQVIAQYHAARPHRFKIINKVLRHSAAVESVYESLARERDSLQIDQFECVMFHHPASVNESVPDDFFSQLQQRGISARAGLSFENPQEYRRVSGRFPFDVVQLPSNPVNQKFITGDFIDSLARAGHDVHVRSLFLQGLLLAGASVPPYLAGLSPLIERMKQDADDRGVNMIAACLLYALQRPSVGRLVVGAQDVEQWQGIIDAYRTAEALKNSITLPWQAYACDDFDLVHPVQWPKLKAQRS